jgi:hypothetical protein
MRELGIRSAKERVILPKESEIRDLREREPETPRVKDVQTLPQQLAHAEPPDPAPERHAPPNARVQPLADRVPTRNLRLDAEPVIHVTIGRIEVRANAVQSPPPSKERAALPVMSLEEYLRAREKRGS